MSAALAEYRQRYRAARARLWAPAVPQDRPVVRDILRLSAIPAIIYDAPIGPRRPLYADSVVLPTSRERARQIVREVAFKYGFTVEQIVSMSRPPDLCAARHEAYYRLRTETTWSYPSIGRFIGGRDHATVMHGANKHARKLEAGL